MTVLDDAAAAARGTADERVEPPPREFVAWAVPSSRRRRGWLVRRALLAADVIGLTLAFTVTELVFIKSLHGEGVSALGESLVFVLTLPAFVVIAKLYGLYDRDEERADNSTADEFMSVFHLVTVGVWLLVAFTWAMRVADPNVPKLVVFWLLAVTAVVLGRAAARAVCRRQPSYRQNAVVVGAGNVGQLVARKICQHPEYGIKVVGFVDAHPRELHPGLEHVPVLGSLDVLPELISELDVERVLIAFSDDSHEEMLRLLRTISDLDVQVDIVPRLFEIVGSSVDFHTVEGLALVGLRPFRLSRSSQLIKRTADLVLSGTGLVTLAPFLTLVALAVKLDSPGPVFFRQMRQGRGEHVFRIFKFRTMTQDAEAQKADLAALNKHARPGGDPRMFKIENDPRVTRVGRVLRRYSLDELPQLLNVLIGDMSLVGPRPLILDEDQHVEAWARKRLDLRPGITGLWQVLGRSGIPFDEMVRLDYLYVTSWGSAPALVDTSCARPRLAGRMSSCRRSSLSSSSVMWSRSPAGVGRRGRRSPRISGSPSRR